HGVDDTSLGGSFADFYVIPTWAMKFVSIGSRIPVTAPVHTISPDGSQSNHFFEQPVGLTQPAGLLGEGDYAIVIDECQDGALDAEDRIFNPAFRVSEIPTNVPAMTQQIRDVKEAAGAERRQWQITNSAMHNFFAVAKV